MFNRVISYLSIILPILYAGILLGVSFLATPIKFTAPSLTFPVALEVGKVTFHALIKLEWFLASLCLMVLCLSFKTRAKYMIVIFGVLILQSFWLLPILDARIQSIHQDIILEESYFHLIYIILEIIKIICLIIIPCSIIANFLKKDKY